MGSNSSLFQVIYKYVDVLLPLPLPKPYTYFSPPEYESLVAIGSRVLVQFGSKRILTAVVKNIHSTPPQIYEPKSILEVLDDDPLLTPQQLQLIEWIAEYYMCYPGDVLNAATPSGLRLSSESKLQLNPDFDSESGIEFSEGEKNLIELIDLNETLSFEDIHKHSNIKKPLQLVKSLILKNKVLLFEEVVEKYKPKTIKKLRLKREFFDKDQIRQLFEEFAKKPKQTDLLLKYLSIIPVSKPELNEKGLEKSILTGVSSDTAVVSKMIKAGIFEEFKVIVPRFKLTNETTDLSIVLNEEQEKAKLSIIAHFQEKDTVLLHGITGSGKTEIFIDLIQKALEGGSQVLYLLPEIALTTQIVQRLGKYFGNKMGVYHSRFSDNERVEVYKGLLTGRFQLILGVRSSIFLPFDNLGLIIVDEEHETSYKQQEPAPRYNARDVALVLARMHHAKTVLGTATPSIESYFHAKTGKWGLVTLLKRFGEAKLPTISLTDLKREKKHKLMRNDFSGQLLDAIKNALAKNEQVILFQNRRGYAPYLQCDDCNFVFSRKNCDVSLTYHLNFHQLNCHYCGHAEKPANACPACGSAKIKTSGFGTEKLEDDLRLFIPEARIKRMDLDTTRKKNSFQELVEEFDKGETNVLIGTQMISKGWDFGNVSLVGIFDADRMIYYPDFRSHERAFNLLTQVSGRAGRKDKAGQVIIQTESPQNKLFQYVINNDYESFYQQEILERKKFFYPPFSRMIKIIVRNPDKTLGDQTVKELFKRLHQSLGQNRVLGPETPIINKIRNYYLFNIYIKLERENVSLTKAKAVISEIAGELLANKSFRTSQIIFDVDPL